MPISREDVEFYEGVLVMTVAKALAGEPWDGLSRTVRQHRLDQATTAVQALLSSEEAMQRLAYHIQSS